MKIPEDKDILIPIPEELELYELAKKHLKKNYTYKDVAAWLTTRSGRKIGPSALHERINRERKKQERPYKRKLLCREVQRSV